MMCQHFQRHITTNNSFIAKQNLIEIYHDSCKTYCGAVKWSQAEVGIEKCLILLFFSSHTHITYVTFPQNTIRNV